MHGLMKVKLINVCGFTSKPLVRCIAWALDSGTN